MSAYESSSGVRTWGQKPQAPVIPLSYRAPEAAAALGISERTLWELTQRGQVPCVRLGRAVLYPVDGLRAWLTQRTASAEPADGGSAPSGAAADESAESAREDA